MIAIQKFTNDIQNVPRQFPDTTLAEVFPCFFLRWKANARV
jgi:hypothetical protein